MGWSYEMESSIWVATRGSKEMQVASDAGCVSSDSGMRV